jgi:hypothetical protein
MGRIYLHNDEPGGDHESVDHPGEPGPYLDSRDGRVWTHADPDAYWTGPDGKLAIYERADISAAQQD